jgi:hypothetical protein
MTSVEPRLKRGAARKAAGEILRRRQAIMDRYRGGLPAELQSRDKLMIGLRQSQRALVARRRGRRIDLAGLLSEHRADGLPLWAIVDPTVSISAGNGKRDSDGTFYVAMAGDRCSSLYVRYRPHDQADGVRAFVPLGMPVIPRRAREILRDEKVRRRAKWVGVLYQPEEWQEVNPDPAIVVEWKDAPGEFYALAVWGGDRARIMEFVY